MSQSDAELIRALDAHIKQHMMKLKLLIALSIVLVLGLGALSWTVVQMRTRQLVMDSAMTGQELNIHDHSTQIHALQANSDKITDGLHRIESAVDRIDKKLK